MTITIQGTYVSGRRELTYWTQCEHCKEQKACKKEHTCDHPGRITFGFAGQENYSATWSGIIDLRKIASTVRMYLECEEDALPDDIYVPSFQMQFSEIDALATLREVQAGDKVVRWHYYKPSEHYSLDTVTRVTKTRIWIGEEAFRRDGTLLGGFFTSDSIQSATPGALAKMQDPNLKVE